MSWTKPLRAAALDGASLRRIPAGPGVYLWLRGLPLKPDAVLDTTELEEFVRQATAKPLLQTKELQLGSPPEASEINIRPGLLRFAGVSIGGGSLSAFKLDALLSYATDFDRRLRLYSVLQDAASRYGPVLYVGETADLRARIRDHLRGKTALHDRLADLGLSNDDVLVSCAELPELEKKERQVLEQILTHILVAPLTHRAG